MEKAERHTLFGNSTENITQWQAEYKTEPHNSSMKVPQDSIQIVINSTSIKMIKENNQTELNLVSNSSDKSSNKSTKIEFTTMEDRNTTNTKTSLVSTSSIIVTEDPQIQPIAQTGSYNTSTYDSTTNAYNDKTILSGKNGHKHILTHKLRHKILKHLNLVPIEDEPFGGVLWRDDSKYMMSICVPIAVGIVGAACIIGMAYAARRCYKNERKIQEIRAALQAQINANRNDETVLLESSDEE